MDQQLVGSRAGRMLEARSASATRSEQGQLPQRLSAPQVELIGAGRDRVAAAARPQRRVSFGVGSKAPSLHGRYPSHTSSISRSSCAGLSGSRFTANGSVPCRATLGASPFGSSIKANRHGLFCRCPSMSYESYWPLSSVRAFDHRSRLGLSVRSTFRLAECLTSFADCTAYYALC